MSDDATLVLASLIGARPTRRLDLVALERALVRHSIGNDLDDALTRLGAPPCAEAAEQRRLRRTRQATRDAVQTGLQSWPEPWARDYGHWLVRSGQMARCDRADARQLLDRVRDVLDTIATAEPGSLNRTELAVSLFGSSHALDDGAWLERCARRAVWHLVPEPRVDYRQCRAVWTAAGVTTDRVSAPVLVWKLPLDPDSPLGRLVAAANRAALPLHLSEYALDTEPLRFDTSRRVLVVENPRVVEAAAERRVDSALVCTHGNPTGAVLRVIDAMLEGGVDVRHHGDFDSAGIAICRRLAERGCIPWRMTARDYQNALQTTAAADIELPHDPSPCGSTPWDPDLEACFDEHRMVVHEELLIDVLLGMG